MAGHAKGKQMNTATDLNTDQARPSLGSLADALVMMVDDESVLIEITQAFLEDAGYRRFISTTDSTEAIALLLHERPHVLLLDLNMPKMSGFDILAQMQSDKVLKHIPVIVMTSADAAQTKLKALELGAMDFLSKPVDPSELTLRLRNNLAAKAYVDRVTYYDVLTGLHNRVMFIDHLDWALRQSTRYGRSGAVLHINIDRFKQINDALGPALGDELLMRVAKRLEKCIRSNDTLAQIGDDRESPSVSRLGSDEFAVLLTQVDKVESTVMVAKRLLDTMTAPFELAGRDLYATCSIGIAVFPPDGMDRNLLLQNATVALHHAKQRGGNAYCFHSGELNDRSVRYLNLHGELRKAIDRNEFLLFYQPKLDTRTKRLVGAEALLRWKHPERGMVSPMEFIPLAEDTGLIVPIGAWVLAEACRQAKAWQSAGLDATKIAINISGRQFREVDFVQSIRDTLRRAAIDSKHVQIELTESMLMDRADESVALLHQLRALGLKLSIDDFGTGYSSLSYLGQFPIDELKIDRSFLGAIDSKTGDGGAPIVVAIIALAHSLGLSVVAEGVETEAQWAFLRDRGCDQCQGYLFGKPVPAAEFARLLAPAGKRADATIK